MSAEDDAGLLLVAAWGVVSWGFLLLLPAALATAGVLSPGPIETESAGSSATAMPTRAAASKAASTRRRVASMIRRRSVLLARVDRCKMSTPVPNVAKKCGKPQSLFFG
jgi:hypothetical protein